MTKASGSSGIGSATTITVDVDTSPIRESLRGLTTSLSQLGLEAGGQYAEAISQGLEVIGPTIEGLTENMADALVKTTEGMSENMRAGVEVTLSALGDAFAEFAQTGELNVKRMVQTILTELARVVFDEEMQDDMVKWLKIGVDFAASLFSPQGGGASVPLPGKALGGSVGFGKPYVVGEQGRELFVPETSGRIVPSGGMGGGNITFNVQATDVQSFQRSESQIAAMLNRAARRGNRNL